MLPVSSVTLLGAALLLLLLFQCPCGSLAQKGKKTEPECLGVERVCNAVIHFPDKVIDQGRYCNGCANCTAPVGLDARNSFQWQHFEHPRMRVQFLKCGAFQADRVCGPRDVKAAVFVSPRRAWEPSLEQMFCRCPADWGAKVPVYHLISWHLEADQWVYEFGCRATRCSVSAPVMLNKERLVGSVCARKRRQSPDSPVDVNFLCACPPDFHCYVADQDPAPGGGGGGGVEQRSGGGDAAGGGGGDSQGSEGGGIGGKGGLGSMDDIETVSGAEDWRQVLDDATGSYVYEKRQRCEKRVANQTSTEN